MKKLFAALVLFALLVVRAPEVDRMPGLSPLAVEFGGAGTTDTVEFFGKVVGQESRSLSAWVYLDAISADIKTIAYFSEATFFEGSGVLGYAQQFSSAFGQWQTNAAVLSAGAWTHVVITKDSTTADPLIYVNGVSKTVIETATPSGVNYAYLETRFQLGGDAGGGADNPWNGKIYDARVYDRILTAGEVTTLYNGGTPSISAGYSAGSALYNTSLIFQGFAVRTEDLASYTDVALPGNVFEAQYMAVGVPSGAPVGRSAP